MRKLLFVFAILAAAIPDPPIFCGSPAVRDPEDIVREWTGEDSETAEYFYNLLVYPVNFATATERDLERFPVLSRRDIRRILDYRETRPFGSLLELTNAGLDGGVLGDLAPFAFVRRDDSLRLRLRTAAGFFRSEKRDLSNRITNRFSEAQGMISRARLEAGGLSAGYVFRWHTNQASWPPASEFMSNARYCVRYDGGAVGVWAGHFRAEFGQGLLFGPPLSFSVQRIDREPVRVVASGVSPYTSLSEDPDGDGKRDFFSGFAARLKFPDPDILRPQVTLFASENPDGYDTALNLEAGNRDSRALAGATVWSRAVSGEGRATETAFSGYGEWAPFEPFLLFGEYAWSRGQAFRAGSLVSVGFWKISALAYRAESNFTAPHGSPFLHGSRNTLGYFLGVSAGSASLGADAWADLSGQPLEFRPAQRYQARFYGAWKTGWDFLSGVSAAISSKYSCTDPDVTLRSGATLRIGFLGEALRLDGKWRNLLHMTRREMGNLYSLALRVAPERSYRLSVRWTYYRSAGYHSALYLSAETADPSEFSLPAYYGVGYALDLVLKWVVNDGLSFSARYGQDDRELEYRTAVLERSVSAYLTALL